MQQDKKNIHGIVIYSKDPDYRSRLSQLIVHERRHRSHKDLFAATDFIFCKSIAKIKKYSSLYPVFNHYSGLDERIEISFRVE